MTSSCLTKKRLVWPPRTQSEEACLPQEQGGDKATSPQYLGCVCSPWCDFFPRSLPFSPLLFLLRFWGGGGGNGGSPNGEGYVWCQSAFGTRTKILTLRIFSDPAPIFSQPNLGPFSFQWFFPKGGWAGLRVSLGGREVEGKPPSLSGLGANHLKANQSFPSAEWAGFPAWLHVFLCQVSLSLYSSKSWVAISLVKCLVAGASEQRWEWKEAKAKPSHHTLVNSYWANTVCEVMCCTCSWANPTEPPALCELTA